MQVTIYSDNTITVGSQITGYQVSQRDAGTIVRKWHNNGRPQPKDLGDVVRMPQARYTLSSQAGLDQFKADFLAIWSGA